jgi:hypothetical protein
MEFKGVVNINEAGEVVCFCSHKEVLQGKCACHKKYDLPQAIISVEVIPGSRPSEQAAKKADKAGRELVKDANKIKEGLTQLEKSVKGSKFRV